VTAFTNLWLDIIQKMYDVNGVDRWLWVNAQ
jgi:hypothetical protein